MRALAYCPICGGDELRPFAIDGWTPNRPTLRRLYVRGAACWYLSHGHHMTRSTFITVERFTSSSGQTPKPLGPSRPTRDMSRPSWNSCGEIVHRLLGEQ